MKKYVIRVNGTAYDVEVEEAQSDHAMSAPSVRPVRPAPAPASEPIAPPRQKTVPAPAEPVVSENAITAPMAGTIVKVLVKSGETVASGDVLLVLEAMKMENDVMASGSARILKVHVDAGDIVNAGDLLVTLE